MYWRRRVNGVSLHQATSANWFSSTTTATSTEKDKNEEKSTRKKSDALLGQANKCHWVVYSECTWQTVKQLSGKWYVCWREAQSQQSGFQVCTQKASTNGSHLVYLVTLTLALVLQCYSFPKVRFILLTAMASLFPCITVTALLCWSAKINFNFN